MNAYISIQDLDLSNASLVGFDDCTVELKCTDLVCTDIFGRAVVKFPIELNIKYKHLRGLPDDVFIDEDGYFVPFDIDYDDEDYFEEQPIEILESYSYISSMAFTLIIKHD